MPRRRPHALLLATLAALAAPPLVTGCVAILGLGEDRFQDADAAAKALCSVFAKECKDQVDPELAWGPSCEKLLSPQLDMENEVLANLTDCFGKTACRDLVTCLDRGGVKFATVLGAGHGQPCLDTCVVAQDCRPWECGPPDECVSDEGAGSACGSPDAGAKDSGPKDSGPSDAPTEGG